jgi:hypothetical protein
MELHVCVCCLCRLAQDPCPVGCKLEVVVLMTLFTYVLLIAHCLQFNEENKKNKICV